MRILRSFLWLFLKMAADDMTLESHEDQEAVSENEEVVEESQNDEDPEGESEQEEGGDDEDGGGAEEEDEDEDEDEEDLVDPVESLREKCSEKGECARFKEKLDQCNEHVLSRTKTEETCNDELLDFVHCVDTCVAKPLFHVLK